MSLPHEAFVDLLKRTESLMEVRQPSRSSRLCRELARMDREDVEALAAMIVGDLDRRDDEDFAHLSPGLDRLIEKIERKQKQFQHKQKPK